MIISDKKLIFIHIPKTGGNSFSHLLIDYSKEMKKNIANILNNKT